MFVFSRVQEIKATFGLGFGQSALSLQELAGQRGGFLLGSEWSAGVSAHLGAVRGRV